MRDRQSNLVRVDHKGTAHPVGREASRAMRRAQGPARLLSSPSHTIVLESDDASTERLWLVGRVVRAGGLWDIIGLAGQGSWTGELVVQADDVRRVLYLEAGAVIGASSSSRTERLGAILYQYGVLSEEQVAEVASKKGKHQRFGEAAVEMGLVTNERLFEIAGKQIEEITFAAMAVARGGYYFSEGFDPDHIAHRVSLPVTFLLMEGVTRIDEIEAFKAKIPSPLHVPRQADPSRIAADHEIRWIFDAVDGQRSVDDLGRAIGLGLFDTTRALYQMVQLHAVVMDAPRPTGRAGLVELFNSAIRLILEHVDTAGAAADVREQLASFATASGIYDTLFRDAGPLPDGTLKPAAVAATAEILVGPENAESMLRQWLYEYASFAMFIAEPFLRAKSAPKTDAEPMNVAREVAQLLRPLTPE